MSNKANLIHVCNICSKENIHLSEVTGNQILNVEDLRVFFSPKSTKFKDSNCKQVYGKNNALAC